MKLITEVVQDIKPLIVEANGKKQYFIEGIFAQSELKNRNGRMYPQDVLDNAMQTYIDENVKTKRALGELNHPDHVSVNPERASHIVTELKKKGNNWIGKARVLTEMPMGRIVKALLDEGVSVGVSTRGVGSLTESEDGTNVVNDDFTVSAIDVVSDPSAPEAYVRGILEGREWCWDNGKIIEATVEKHKRTMKKRFDEATAIKAFEEFINLIAK